MKIYNIEFDDKEKLERNLKIYTDKLEGATWRELGIKYNLAYNALRTIIERYKLKFDGRHPKEFIKN